MLHLNTIENPDESATPLKWAIIGGGIHGVMIARELLDSGIVHPENLQIVDPAPELLHNWKVMTRSIAMQHLRSPMVHHLDADPFSLRKYADAQSFDCEAATGAKMFIEPNNRPALDLFNRHSDHVIASRQLTRLHVQSHVSNLSPVHSREAKGTSPLPSEARGVWPTALEQTGREYPENAAIDDVPDIPRLFSLSDSVSERRPVPVRWKITHSYGHFLADRVILATGRSLAPEPGWATDLRDKGGYVQHVLSSRFASRQLPKIGTMLVVGGGLTAGQAALMLHHRGLRVIMTSRHPLRSEPYDSDPGWMGPKYLTKFYRASYNKRRAMIRKARNRGTVTPEIYAQLNVAMSRGDIRVLQANVTHTEFITKDLILATLSDGSRPVISGVILATGLETARPGGKLINDLINSMTLPLGQCGFPAPGASLEWAKGLYISGSLAELELGPVSPNITGARMAAQRIIANERRKRQQSGSERNFYAGMQQRSASTR